MDIFKTILSKGTTIQINGQTYSGKSVIIRDGQVFVDGGLASELDTYTISVTINGDVQSVETASGDIEVVGDVTGRCETASGDITCGAVGGDVSTMSGDVECGHIAGNVRTMSGDVHMARR